MVRLSFFLKKLGFCRAEIKVGADSRGFFIPRTPYDQEDLLWVAQLDLAEESSMVLHGEKDNFSEAQFELLCDIATEGWKRAAARWKELHGSDLTFEAVASRPKGYNAVRARNLYRPTY